MVIKVPSAVSDSIGQQRIRLEVARFKIHDRVRIVTTVHGYQGQTGIITGVEHPPRGGVSADQREAYELHRGYIVTLYSGHTQHVTGLDLEPEDLDPDSAMGRRQEF
jgi:hypothetical protein